MNAIVKTILTRVLPGIFLFFAICLGWFLKHDLPLGTFFATVIPLTKGKVPATIIGHGFMKGTPPVPKDFMPQARPKNEMFLRLKGGSKKMPQAGIGMCCRYSAYDDVLVRRTVLWYLLQGGRHIDTAHLYLNHRAIGLAIQDAMERGISREEIFVTTKIAPTHFGYEKTLETVPKYLEEMQLDYVDLVLMHAPTKFPFMANGCKEQGTACRQETWKALSELRERGLTTNVGVSNFVVSHMQDILSMEEGAPIAVNQFQYNPWAADYIMEAYDFCKANKIAVTGYFSLGGSFQHFQAATVDTLQNIAAKYEKTVAQVMLRWSIQKGVAVIPGTGNPKHMVENLEVYSFKLTKEDMDDIDQLRDDDEAKKWMYGKPFSD